MNRRTLLKTLTITSIPAISGCVGDDDQDAPSTTPTPTPGEEETPQPTPTPTPTEVYTSTIDTPQTLENGLRMNVEQLLIPPDILVEETDWSGESEEVRKWPYNDRMFIFIIFHAENTGDDPVDFPRTSDIKVVFEGGQYDHTDPGGEVLEPLNLNPYERIDNARSGVEEIGWIMYETPRHDGDIEISWFPAFSIGDTEEVTWTGSVTGSTLPVIEHVLMMPESNEIGPLPVEVGWTNTGGQETRRVTELHVEHEEGFSDTLLVDDTIPSNETITSTLDYDFTAIGNVSADFGPLSSNTNIRRATFSYEEGEAVAENPSVVVHEPSFPSQIEHNPRFGSSEILDPDDGNTFVLVEVVIENPYTEVVRRPRRDDFLLFFEDRGEHSNTIDLSNELIEPIEGNLLNHPISGTIDPGETIHGYVVFEVAEAVTTDSSLEVEATWSLGTFDGDTGMVWSYD